MAFRESDFLAWVSLAGVPPAPAGPGDDAAVLPDGQVLSVDAVVEGVHFEPGTPPRDVACKALGAALSDVCAMGAQPGPVLVAALLPPGSDGRGLAAALVAACERYGVALAGGDTVRTNGPLALVVTVTGRCPQGAAPWLRSGARPGDRLLVSGALGGARAGRHLRPKPRRDVVQTLRAGPWSVNACIDLSDGLGTDLPRLCAASGVGARVEAAAIPVHADVTAERDGLSAALGDGEDYELLLALPPEPTPPALLRPIGVVVAEGPPLLLQAGKPVAWPGGGYEHAF